MINLTTTDIIEIIKAVVQIFIYVIIFIKLHNLKGKPLTVADIMKKAKDGISKFVGTFNLTSLIELLERKENKDKDTETPSEDNKDNG